MAQAGRAGMFLFHKRQVKKKRRRFDRKSKRLRRNIFTGPAAAACSLPRRWETPTAQPLQRRLPAGVSCEDGRSSFFQIAAFLLREGGRVSPATLECRSVEPWHCGAVSVPVRFRHLCSKKLLYPDSIVILVAELVHVADRLGVAAGEMLGGEEEPLVLVVGQFLNVGILRLFLHGLPGLLNDLRGKTVG